MDKGQSLVEFALVLPIALFMVLALVEYGFLRATKDHQDRETSVVAVWAAGHNGEAWNAVAQEALPGCDVAVSQKQDVITAESTCHYTPRVTSNIWAGLALHSTEQAAVTP